MNSIAEFLANPLLWKVIAGYWLFNALVTALPQADAQSNKAYQFVYRFMHTLAGNVDRAAQKFSVPGAQ